MKRERTAVVFVAQPAGLDDPTTAGIERFEGIEQALALEPIEGPIFEDLGRFAVRRPQIGDRCIVVFAAIIGRLQRDVTATHAGFHLDHVLHPHIEVTCDRLRGFRAQRVGVALHRAQVEEQLALRLGRGDFDEPPVLQDVLMDFRLDPVHGKRHQPHATIGIEAFDRLHQTDVTFLDEVGMGQSIAHVLAGNRDDQPQMRQHQLTGSVEIAVVLQAAREGHLAFSGEHRDPMHRRDVSVDIPDGRNGQHGTSGFRGTCQSVQDASHSDFLSWGDAPIKKY